MLHLIVRLHDSKLQEGASLFATQQLIREIYLHAEYEVPGNYVRERVTNYWQLPQVQLRRTFVSFPNPSFDSPKSFPKESVYFSSVKCEGRSYALSVIRIKSGLRTHGTILLIAGLSRGRTRAYLNSSCAIMEDELKGKHAIAQRKDSGMQSGGVNIVAKLVSNSARAVQESFPISSYTSLVIYWLFSMRSRANFAW